MDTFSELPVHVLTLALVIKNKSSSSSDLLNTLTTYPTRCISSSLLMVSQTRPTTAQVLLSDSGRKKEVAVYGDDGH
ncbi:hypothetical protein TYRP_005806 [Tyrophagus putrescentiae]|nr:hypothetical protein TYRP_005806 [Tyrophagus putrescentiae]